jgi:CDP-4-dehydro-6-deoxyglucose reductase, E3
MLTVTILPYGRSFPASPDESVLAAAVRAGHNLPHSCRSGHCSSCRARVVSGRVEYPGATLPAGITPGEVAAGLALLCQARAATDLVVEVREVRAVADVEIRRLPCRVERLERLSHDVMAVVLRLPAVEPFPYAPGQYVDILLPEGRRRSFSIASAPADGPHLELHVRRASEHGFTAQVFDRMSPGTLLRIEGPLGQFAFDPDSPRPALLVGGGTGYAPLRSMLRQFVADGARRPVTLYWGARTAADLYEDAWLRGLAQGGGARWLDYRPVLSEPERSVPAWTGRVGHVHEAVLGELGTQIAGCDVYASGPPAMIEAIRRDFALAGLPAEQLRFDSFDYAPDALAASSVAAARD